MDCERIIGDLQTRLECALERVQDAEDGAIALLAENGEILDQIKLSLAKTTLLQNQLTKAKKGAAVNFIFGAGSFGVGASLMTAGIITDNKTAAWTGAGVIAGTGLVWAAGHFIFNWW